jgi:glutamine synthetase
MRVHIPIRAGGDTHLVPEGSTKMGDVFKADDVSDLRDWPLPGTNRPKLAAGARDRLAPRETNGAGEAAAESVIVEVFLTDANGLSRGNGCRRARGLISWRRGYRCPFPFSRQDIWGRDVNAARLAHGAGDPDGLYMAIDGSSVPVSWLPQPTTQIMLRMMESNGAPFFADPRTVLESVLVRFSAAGLSPIAATEIEFYLTHESELAGEAPRPRGADHRRWKGWHADALNIEALHDEGLILADIARFAREQKVPIETIIRENGPGQYEVNFSHTRDIVRVADWTIMLKRIVRGAARCHGMDATFMAKP